MNKDEMIRYLMTSSVFWAIHNINFAEGPDEPTPDTQSYNIYVDAKNGDNANSGLFETVPVQTMNRAGLVMASLPSDRETRGVNIYMWGSTLADPTTVYTDYNDVTAEIGAPLSTFIGMNNYRITKNPNPLNVNHPIIDGGSYSKTDTRRVALNAPHRPAFLYLEGNNITVDSLEMTNIAGNAIRHRGNNGVFRDMYVHNTNGEAFDSAGNDNLFEHIHVHHIDENLSEGREGDAFQISPATRTTIRYCWVHNISGTAYNLSSNTNECLVYLCTAYLCGYPNGLAGAQQARNSGIGVRMGGFTPGVRNAALGNRFWDCYNSIQAQDKGSHMIAHNIGIRPKDREYLLMGTNAMLIANNISAELGAAQRLYTTSRQATDPRFRSNSWGAETGWNNQQNMNMGLSSLTQAQIYKSTVVPAEPHSTTFEETTYLPLESRFAGVATHDFGFGKHVGPTNAVVTKLKSMTIQQLRDLVKLYV
jgi:hypothetical protein